MRRAILLTVGVCMAALIGCADGSVGQPRPTQAQALCQSWGYDANDPVCLQTFRHDRQ